MHVDLADGRVVRSQVGQPLADRSEGVAGLGLKMTEAPDSWPRCHRLWLPWGKALVGDTRKRRYHSAVATIQTFFLAKVAGSKSH